MKIINSWLKCHLIILQVLLCWTGVFALYSTPAAWSTEKIARVAKISPPITANAADQTAPINAFGLAIFKEIAEQNKWNIEYVDCTAATFKSLADADEIDIIPLLIKPLENNDNEIIFAWSNILHISCNIYIHGHSGITFLEDLAGKTIAFRREDPLASELPVYLKRHNIQATIITLDIDSKASLKMLQNGTVDALAASNILVEKYFATDNHYSEIVNTGISLSSRVMTLAFTEAYVKDHPTESHAINHGIYEYMTRHPLKYNRLYLQSFGYDHNIKSFSDCNYIFLSIGFLFILLVSLYLYRSKIKRKIHQKLLADNKALKLIIEQNNRTAERIKEACHSVVVAYYELDIQTRRVTGDDNFFILLTGEVREFLEYEELMSHVYPGDLIPLQDHHPDLEQLTRDELEPIEGRIYDANNNLRYMRIYAKNYFDNEGRLISRKGSVLDITNEKLQEIELKRLNSQLANTQRIAKVANWEIDLSDPEYIIASEEFFDIIGLKFTGEYKLHSSITDIIFSKEDCSKLELLVQDALKRNFEFGITLPLMPLSGYGQKWVHITSIAYDANLHTAAKTVVGVMQDITLLHQAEEQTRHSEKMKALGRLAGGIAHNFNNQLYGILGFSELIKNENISEKVAEYIDYVIDSGEKSSELVKKLLSFSRMESDEPEIIDVEELVDDAIIFIQQVAGPNITLKKLSKESCLSILGCYNELHSSILNLGINAVDAINEIEDTGHDSKIFFAISSLTFTKEEGEKLKLQQGKYALLEISDNGIGMTEEVKSHVLEPFFTTKPDGHGTGIGLSSVNQIVKSLNGTLTITSRKGAGTTIRLYLPIIKRTANNEKKNPQSKATKKVTAKKILIVDDDKCVLRLVTMMLSKAGCDAHCIAAPLETIPHYREHCNEYDIVILDMLMPEINGVEIFKALQEINRDVKVILMTGYSNEEVFNEVQQAGIRYFLHKPISQEQLFDKIAEIMQT